MYVCRHAAKHTGYTENVCRCEGKEMNRLLCDFRVVGPVQTNCYFLYHEDTRECVIIDPGAEEQTICTFIEEKELKPTAILLTHGHFDHIMAAGEVKKQYGIKIYAAAAERELLADAVQNVSSQIGKPVALAADVWLEDGQELELLGQTMRCILTPGHTVGGMCYYFPKAGYLFAGDTLFQESVGRTDLPTGSMQQLIRSIREKLFLLPDAVRVYPGHGMMTSVQNEKQFNPFAQ